MNTAPTIAAENVSHVETPDVPQHIVVAFQEALIRDGREAAMYVIAGRGHSFKDVSAAAERMYGTPESM